MNLTLGFDTSAGGVEAVLMDGGSVLSERREEMERGQAEALFPILEDMLAGAGASWRDLARIGVGSGPGNFTGIRISVAAARGLALSLGVPAIGVTGFESLIEGREAPALCLLPARGERFYAQVMSSGEELSAPLPLTTDDPLPDLSGLADPVSIGPSGWEPPARDWRPVTAHIRVERSLAVGAALRARRIGSTGSRPAPLYVKPVNASLPSEAPPTILP